MRQLWLGVLAVALVPSAAFAQQAAPEDLLSDGNQVYLRWDGVKAHKGAYDKTALGKMMQGDTGKFVNQVFSQMQDGLGTLLTVEQLLGGVPPEKLQKMQADATLAAKILPTLAVTGFVFAAEVKALEPQPQATVTIIIPDAGEKGDQLFAAIRLISALNKTEVQSKEIKGAKASFIDYGVLRVIWWMEGKHAVLIASTDKPEDVVAAAKSDKNRLTGAPLFKKLKDFNKFETSARAFLNVESLVKMAKSRDPKVAKIIDDLGLGGLKNLTFWSGFEGEAERGYVEWDMPGPRKGLLALLGGKQFTMKDVPPLPPDVVSWSMTNFDMAAFYDTMVPAVAEIAKLVGGDEAPDVPGAIKSTNDLLGIDIRKDLIGSLDGRFLVYNSPGEGPLTLGQVVAFKVKDEKKLQETLEQLLKGIAKVSGQDVRLKKRTYHGVEVREVHVKAEGFFFLPTYAIHNGWLVVAYYPQGVHGFIARSKGEMEAWKPSEQDKKMLDQLPKEMVSVSFSDPRPSIKQLLSAGPLVASLIASFTPESTFEVGSLPNAQEATKHLFPNWTVTSDDGKTLRLDTRASLALPFDVTGLDTYTIGLFFGFAARGGFRF